MLHCTPMLDIRLIREQPDFVKSRLATRGGDDQSKVDEVLAVDAERRKMETALQQCNADRKRLSKEIGGARSRGEDSAALEERVRQIGDEITELVRQTAVAEERQRDLLLNIPKPCPTPMRRSADQRGRESGRAQLGRETAVRFPGAGSRRARRAAASCSIRNGRRS